MTKTKKTQKSLTSPQESWQSLVAATSKSINYELTCIKLGGYLEPIQLDTQV